MFSHEADQSYRSCLSGYAIVLRIYHKVGRTKLVVRVTDKKPIFRGCPITFERHCTENYYSEYRWCPLSVILGRRQLKHSDALKVTYLGTFKKV